MTLPLTHKQEQLWRFIASCERSPSYAEMAIALYGHVNAKGRINIMVSALKERGFVDYIPCRPRSITAREPRKELSSFPTKALTDELARRAAQ